VSVSRVIELTDRLTYWTEPHPAWQPNPEWPEEVGCVLYAATDATTFIDPLIRHDLDETAWTWLDERVSVADAPVAVLLTAPWHERSTRDVVYRHGARVWIDPAGQERVGDMPKLDAVPAGINVFKPRGVNEGQVAFLIASEHALIVAEFFLGTPAGLKLCPSPGGSDPSDLAESLTELTRMPIERVLVGHGPPILEGGSDAISAALKAFRGS
jgi:glyoxylase-like metal-dependent hydrolase (beta-lactamase superfamily II)